MTCNSQSDDFVQAKSNSATLKIVYVGWEPWPSGYGWRLKVVGSNPGAVYWMDIFHIDLLKKLFEKTENKRKEAGFGHLKIIVYDISSTFQRNNRSNKAANSATWHPSTYWQNVIKTFFSLIALSEDFVSLSLSPL